MATPAKTTKSALSVVESGEAVAITPAPVEVAPPAPISLGEDAFAAVESALETVAQESRPLVLRSHVRREKIIKDLREVESLLADAVDREKLLDQAYEAAKKSLASHKMDLEDEIELMQAGLRASQLRQGQTEA
ncbi:hypothetical protein SAMN05216456_1280 [Devosia crocina]|uniref:Uncharacterized protein n=1 Tax=Devosia crocina TaxID=429728 RepID=A0A1I7N9A3_9HYPH|nr:hypothetical protein [Devosia crocina]SFV31247.1 hypothetical protein SAMN05216456_1280 [Devosia crocina]